MFEFKVWWMADNNIPDFFQRVLDASDVYLSYAKGLPSAICALMMYHTNTPTFKGDAGSILCH